MTSLRRTLTVPVPIEVVAAFLSDLTTSTEWDVHTRACSRLDTGPLRVGARYEHTRQAEGHEVSLRPVVSAYEPGRRIEWTAEHPFAAGQEHFAFTATADGTEVEHGVELHLRGLARLGEGLVRPVMARIADGGTPRLTECLSALRG